MAIDSRVAHGIAGRHLEDALQASMRVMKRVTDTVNRRSTRPSTHKGARRLVKEVHRPIVEHSFWFAEGEDRRDGPWIVWLAANTYGNDARQGLQLFRHRFRPGARGQSPFEAEYIAGVSVHAVARCLQRNGTLSWTDVKPILADAAAFGLLMAGVASLASLKQIAVHAGDGLFVGGLDDDGDPQLETYLKVDEALPSRWSSVRAVQLATLAAVGLSRDEVCAAAAYGQDGAWMAVMAKLAQELDSFSWLREPYDPKLDPLSKAWNDYRLRERRENSSNNVEAE